MNVRLQPPIPCKTMMLHSELGWWRPCRLCTLHQREARLGVALTRLEKQRQRAGRRLVAELSFEGKGLETGHSVKGKKLDGGLSMQFADEAAIVVQLKRELRAAEEIAGLPKLGSQTADNRRETQIFLVKRPLFMHMLARFCDVLEDLVLSAVHGPTKHANYFMLGNYAPVDEFGPERVFSVKGKLPECLNGELVRAGPNPRFKPKAGYHWFDGDGMLHGLRIKDGKVTYVARYVRTSRLAQEEYWGGPKFDRIGDMTGRKGLFAVGLYLLRVALGVVDLSNGSFQGNTALTYHNGRLLTLNEADKPYLIRVLEDGDLETLARVDYDKMLNHPFTAHPKIDPDTGEMFTFGYSLYDRPYVTYRVVSKDGVMRDPVGINIRAPIMMHDFAITENYAIFLDLPVLFKPQDMVIKNDFIFSFDEKMPARFGVLPRYAEDESQIRWFELSSCLIFHNANAWEEGDDVVLISCRSPHLELGGVSVQERSMLGESDVEMWEYRFNMKTGNATERKLGDLRSDFPRINDDYIGRKNRFVYTGIFQDSLRIIGVAKYDLSLEPKLGAAKPEIGGNIAGLFWHGHKRAGSEPVFVPKQRGREVEEDDGYLLNFVFDELRSVSEVVVVDAKTMSPDPVAVIELPARVPHCFHALFVPEAELQLQKS